MKKKQKILKVGLVGSGFAANFHYESYKKVENKMQVAGVYSPNKAHREQFAENKCIVPFGSFEEMLKNVDVVDVCTPPNMHEYYTVEAAKNGKHMVVEKPFTGYFGPENGEKAKTWRGDTFSKKVMLEKALESADNMCSAVKEAKVILCYAENWVYAPVIRKEVEILTASKGQILWMIGEEAHSGSHSPAYGIWRKSGGGSIVGKSCHPLTAALYLKQVEGTLHRGKAIRPAAVSARTHNITKNPHYKDVGFLRTDYCDVEDFALIHIIFEDGFIADIYASEIVMGGVHNWLEIFANNHRIRCNINPVDACVLYNPKEEQLKDVYITEKLGTKQGWSFPSPDEDWNTGYPQEIMDFSDAIIENREPECGWQLGRDTTAVMYAAYLSAEQKGAEVEIPL